MIISKTPKVCKDRWQTPREVFQALDAEFGFCLDAAAGHDNTLCRHYLTEEDDALSCEWHTRGAIFCNPPYSISELLANLVYGDQATFRSDAS